MLEDNNAMQCSLPPPLSPDELSTTLDGDASPAILDHLANCLSCSAQLSTARQLERRLAQQLHRWDCPTAQELTDYHHGHLSPSIMAVIAQHLTGCITCYNEIEDLRVFLDPSTDMGLPAQLSPTVRTRLGALIANIRPPSAAPALRGVAAAPIIAEADGTILILEVATAREGQVSVIGQVVSDDPDQWSDALVELRRKTELLTTALVDDLGGWECGPFPAGMTELRITPLSGRAVVLPQVELAR